jgi:hypothetical protein
LQDLIDNGIDGKQFSRIEAVEKIWEQVTEYFEYFKEWYQNRTLYHYIGFLIDRTNRTKGNILDSLIQSSKKLSKTKFIAYLEEEIAKLVKVDKPIEQLVYESEKNQSGDRCAIYSILLIHNIYSTLKRDKEKSYFPFNLYKQEKKWSLEHIYAQNSESITNRDKQNSWLDDHIKSLSNNPEHEELVQRMGSIRSSQKIEQNGFDEIVDEVYIALNRKNELNNIHSISNLCLLDSVSNSLLNNSIFDVKREKIKKRELEGFYIPVSTRNVFLKAYTEYPQDNVYWGEMDRKAYLASIQNVYDYFINKINVR